jgi:hypothetical protein
MINLLYLSSVRIVLTLVALICYMSFLHMLNLVVQFVMIYILVLIWKLPNISTLPSFYFYQVGLPNCWRLIFLVLPKLDECQIDLTNCWSCS